MVTIFLFLVFFEAGETKTIAKLKNATGSKSTKIKDVPYLAERDDMVAAIVIMPKSYLPALKRFSQSKMARNIKILTARIELQDGNMTAVHRTKNIHEQSHKTASNVDLAEKINTTTKEHPIELEQPVLTAGFLYLLASVQKSKQLN
jgi:hypothetical protein